MPISGFRRDDAAPAAVELDPSQRAVLALPDAASAAVLGAPGTGKTTTIIELVADRVLVRGWSPDQVVVLAASRAAATRLRDRIARRLGVATNGPLARTANSLAFEAVGAAAKRAGAPVPRLVTGGEQDADFAQLLRGHVEEGTGPAWPEELDADVRALRGFRVELRELLDRATDYGVSTDRLRELGAATSRPAWTAAADFADEYRDVVTQSRATQLDGPELMQFAITAIDDGTAGERIERLRLVVVDDAQEITAATLGLLRAFVRRGAAVVAFGDPDVAANGFRGGEAERLGRLGVDLGVPVESLVLERDHRHGEAIRSLVARVTARIGTASAGTQRAARASRAGGAIATISAATPARETAAIARQLREAHLDLGVPWSELAVVVRSGASVSGIRRALALAEVPTRALVGGAPLREDRTARALLDMVDVGSGRTPLDAVNAVALLTGPFGGLDRLALRRLKLALRAEELAGGGVRQADELLVEALADPARLATIDHRIGRQSRRLAETLQQLASHAEAGATIEELLWHVWERSGHATGWYETALGSGIAATEANDALDGVVAVFTAARRYVERQPEAPPAEFLRSTLDAEVPEDTLSPQPAQDAVLVTTPAGVVGVEVDTVVVAGLQEGAWPNLRLRGSLFAPQELVRIARGIDATDIDERRAVLDDELRQFALAVSRARRRVVLSGVDNDDTVRSLLVAFAPPDAEVVDATNVTPLTLRGMTGRLRRELTSARATVTDRESAASGLAQLAREGLPGADPGDWHGLRAASTDLPLYTADEVVPVSPSALGRFEESPLDWFVGLVAGSDSSVVLGLGTIMHWAMETADDHRVEALLEAVETRWSELVFESPWLSERYRRMARTFATGIAEYLHDASVAGAVVVGAEKRFELDIDVPGSAGAQVRGSIDRVERAPDGSVTIIDLKTGTPAPRSEIPEHPQLGAYQLAYASGQLDDVLEEFGAHRPGGARLLWVKEGVGGKAYRLSDQEAFDAERLSAFRDRIRRAALGMALAEYRGLIEPQGYGGPPGWDVIIHRVGQVSGD